MPRGEQKINGVQYVYEYDSTWDADKKYGTHKRNYIGKMVDGVLYPIRSIGSNKSSKSRRKNRLDQRRRLNVSEAFMELPISWMLSVKNWVLSMI